ncbi:hypothetical protein AB4Z19_19990 [Pseudoduganella sp. RAF19]|uniref:hypothetical protein n=1 Tax=Pseudoduganella sp. RAF19 TaxID=3233052 RepID=UPI003F9A2608
MTASYQHLALADVQPGMVLSDELLDVHGKVLLPQGTVLTAEMLALMPRHGVTALPIAQAEKSATELAAEHEKQRERIAHLFRLHDPDNGDDWAANALRRLVIQFRTGQEAA